MKIKKIEVHKLFGYNSYSLDFSETNKSALIFGTNGIGKTTILNIINSLLNKDNPTMSLDYLFDLPFEEVKILFSDDSEIKVKKQNNKIFIEHKNKNDTLPLKTIFDKNDTEDNKTKNIEFYRSSLKTGKIIFLEQQKDFSIIEDFKQKYDDSTFDLNEKFNKFKEFFEGSYDEYDPAIKKICQDNGNLFLRVKTSLSDDFNGVLGFEKMSSGELKLAAILYNIIFNTEDDSIVLIDEPEASLHIVWQQQFTDFVEELMKDKNDAQVISASHSPFTSSGDERVMVEPTLLED